MRLFIKLDKILFPKVSMLIGLNLQLVMYYMR